MRDHNIKSDEKNQQAATGGAGSKPSQSPQAGCTPAPNSCPTCFVCMGEGRMEKEIQHGDAEVIIEYENCWLCDGSGLIYSEELYECQGQGCGVIVSGTDLVAMYHVARCRCGSPAVRFCGLCKSDYPTNSDDWAEAVWSLDDIRDLPIKEIKEENHV